MSDIPPAAITFTTLLVGLLTTGVLVLLPSTWQGDGRALRYWVIGNLALSVERLYVLLSPGDAAAGWAPALLPPAAACVALGAGMHLAAMRLLLQPERPHRDWRWPAALALAVAGLGWVVGDAVRVRLVLMVATSACIAGLFALCAPHLRRLRGAAVMGATMAFLGLMTGTGLWQLGQMAARGIRLPMLTTPTPILALDLVLSVVENLAFLLILIELLQQRVERLSVTDPLTGVLNRRGFLQAANLQILHADRMRYGHRAAAVLLLDLDHFKRVNDSLGHPMGDAVLRGAAERVVASVRQTDVLARWGGEEFVALLPGTPLAQAREVAERIRQAIARAPLADGAPVVTVSIGVAALETVLAVDRLPALIAEADQRLYLAKRQRNCVVAEDADAAAVTPLATPSPAAAAGTRAPAAPGQVPEPVA